MTTTNDRMLGAIMSVQNTIESMHQVMRQIHSSTEAIEDLQNALNNLTLATLDMEKAHSKIVADE